MKVNKKRRRYYVSLYEGFPIYEPAEGGCPVRGDRAPPDSGREHTGRKGESRCLISKK